MQDYDRNVLEKYKIDVSSTRKVRGAVLCDTSRGVFLLKEVSAPAGRIPALCELYAHLIEHGYEGVDSIEPNEDGEFVTAFEDGKRYMLRRWFAGRECDFRKPAELLEASGNLAKLHIIMRVRLSQSARAERLCEEYGRHDRELRKVRKFVRSMTSKGEFEVSFLKYFDSMYQWAEAADDLLAKSDYERLYQESMEGNRLTHGEYNYHNILMKGEEMYSAPAKLLATTNFDKFKQDIQVEDLYYFFRKVMEKHGWKERLGDNMLNAYSAICPLSDEEMEYLKIRLAYPEKFWKIANSYYHSNKAWISVKNVEKLNTAIRQTKEKERFMENIFAFHL
ncbi:MAG: CotS family spore coat protein [Dorea sp.]|nr:CotS family spore coat protein [Dorea sp.]